jgi:hypothetical protein
MLQSKEEDIDALSTLKEDHDKVKKMLQQLEKTTERGVKTREELFSKVKQQLEVHETIEEEIFYPALKDHPKPKRSPWRPTKSTTSWTRSWPRSRASPTTTRPGGAKFKVMKENLEHHIEEDEGEMINQAKQVFDRDEMDQLGESMMALKQELVRQQAAPS